MYCTFSPSADVFVVLGENNLIGFPPSWAEKQFKNQKGEVQLLPILRILSPPSKNQSAIINFINIES